MHVCSKDVRDSGLRDFAMDEGVSVSFKIFITGILTLACAAEPAFVAHPRVFSTFKPDVAIVVCESSRDGVNAVGVLRAIHTPPCQKTRQFSDADSENLLSQNVVDAFGEVGYLFSQAIV
jgi:hypothetical protein